MSLEKTSDKLFYINLIYLFISKMVNYILPFFILIYLISTIGIENYGKLSFSQATVYYFQLLCEFGFAFSGTKQIVDYSNDLKKKSEIISSIYTATSYLIGLSSVLLLVLILFVETFQNNQLEILFFFIGSIFFILTPLWYYQGVQRVKQITAVNVLSKFLLAIGVVFLVTIKSDYLYYPITYAFCNFIPFCYANYIMLKKDKITLSLAPLKSIVKQMKYSKDFFVGTLASGAFYSNITLLLGFFTSDTIVGVYSAAEKLIRALATISSPIAQALFPNVSEKSKINIAKATNFSFRVGFVSSLVVGILSLLSFFLVPILVDRIPFLGRQFGDSMMIFRLMCLFPAVDTFMHTFCSQQLITFNMKKWYSFSYIVGLCFNALIGVILIKEFQLTGAGLVLFLTELLMCIIMMFFILKRMKKLKINFKLKS